MTAKHRIPKEQLLRLIEESPFEHQTSSVHLLDASGQAQRHELAGVSIYSNARGWMAQVNWRAVVDADEITLRVGDAQSGEHAYELRDAERLEIRVEGEGGDAVSEDELSALVAQTSLAKSWEQDVVNVLKQTRHRQATVH
jgi:hypothetical protein